MQSIVERQSQMSNFLMIGKLCLTLPDTHFAYAK